MERGWLIGGAMVLVAVLVTSIVVAVSRNPDPLPEGSPEGTVQRYLNAIKAEDFQLASSFLSEDLMAECPVDMLFGGRPHGEERLEDSRITLERTVVADDTTFVTVRVTRLFGGGPFGTSESSFEARFTLRTEEGRWRFTDYPWPLYRCGPFQPVPRPPEPSATPASGV